MTLFFGLNAFVYCVTVTWLPAILVEAGFSPAEAGSLHGVSQLATAVPGLILGPLVGRLRDQKGVASVMTAVTVTALLGLLLAPRFALLWTAMFGLGTGASFILRLAFISLRAVDVRQSAALSGMSQGVG